MAARRTTKAGEDAILGTVRVIQGSEELLVDRAVAAAVRAVRAVDPDADLAELEASELLPGGIAELTSPSLFAAHRSVVVRGLENVQVPTAEALIGYAGAPQDAVALVIVHRGGAKGRQWIDKLKKAGATVQVCEAPKPWELPRFVTREVRAARGSIDDEAASLLVDAVGTDLRALAGAVSQLLADTEDRQIGVSVVQRYFDGRAQVTSFSVADEVLAGRSARALEQLRWALRAGVVPVLVTAALASGLRGLAKLSGAPPGLRDADLAREVGVPPWKLRSMRGQLRGWDQAGLGEALDAVARADLDVKGGASDPAYALERAILTITRARAGAGAEA